MTNPAPLTALALVCALNPSPARSSCELMAQQVLDGLAEHQVTGSLIRVVDHDVKPGVELSETDDQGRTLTSGKVAVAAVVGNEDGAHHIAAVLFQCLNDVGFTVPAGGSTYWNGEAIHGTDYQDLDEIPDAVASVTAKLVANAAHLARLLKAAQYPPVSS